jgi:putative SOS response-associated peptidase YedK
VPSCGRLEAMCGRYVNVASTEDLTAEFDVDETVGEDLPPSWNIAPTDPVRVVMRRRPHGQRSGDELVTQLRTVRWGLVPSWSRAATGGAKMINARTETVTSKPAFSAAAGRRRCLCPSGGYYEWRTTEAGAKVPYFLHDPGSKPLAFAGLYEIWADPALPEDDPARWLWTCTIITQPAVDTLGHIHDRCPVIVPPELQGGWLDCRDGDAGTARRLLDRIPEAHLQPDVVSTAVNSVRNNGPALVEPVAADSAAVQQPLPL